MENFETIKFSDVFRLERNSWTGVEHSRQNSFSAEALQTAISRENRAAHLGLSDYIVKSEAEFFRTDQEVPAAPAALSRRINFYFQLEVPVYSVWWRRHQWRSGVTIVHESNKTVGPRRLLHFRKEAAYLCFRFHRSLSGLCIYVHRSYRQLHTFPRRVKTVSPESDSFPPSQAEECTRVRLHRTELGTVWSR